MKILVKTKETTWEVYNLDLARDIAKENDGAIFFSDDILKECYSDAFQSGKDKGNLPYKYHPLAISWLIYLSYDLGLTLTEEQQAMVDKINDMNFDEIESFDPDINGVIYNVFHSGTESSKEA